MSSGIFNKYTGYHNRKSTRLRGYDYSQPGAYFITVCIHDRKKYSFGNVVDGAMAENDYGKIVRNCWNDLPSHYPQIRLDEFVVMPNHFHGIIVICDSASVGARSSRPTELARPETAGLSRPNETWQMETSWSSRPTELRDSETGRDDENTGRDDRAPTKTSMDATTQTPIRTPTLGDMVAYFKYQTTKRINAIRQNGIDKIWQRNYYDHIIRDDKSLFNVRHYIRNNPANWATDSEHHLNDESHSERQS
jgi:putative transposase